VFGEPHVENALAIEEEVDLHLSICGRRGVSGRADSARLGSDNDPVEPWEIALSSLGSV